MSSRYIENHFDDIRKFASVIEERLDDEDCTLEMVLKDNAGMLEKCVKHEVKPIYIDEAYQVDIEL